MLSLEFLEGAHATYTSSLYQSPLPGFHLSGPIYFMIPLTGIFWFSLTNLRPSNSPVFFLYFMVSSYLPFLSVPSLSMDCLSFIRQSPSPAAELTGQLINCVTLSQSVKFETPIFSSLMSDFSRRSISIGFILIVHKSCAGWKRQQFYAPTMLQQKTYILLKPDGTIDKDISVPRACPFSSKL